MVMAMVTVKVITRMKKKQSRAFSGAFLAWERGNK
jgi:hypothetical protein